MCTRNHINNPNFTRTIEKISNKYLLAKGESFRLFHKFELEVGDANSVWFVSNGTTTKPIYLQIVSVQNSGALITTEFYEDPDFVAGTPVQIRPKNSVVVNTPELDFYYQGTTAPTSVGSLDEVALIPDATNHSNILIGDNSNEQGFRIIPAGVKLAIKFTSNDITKQDVVLKIEWAEPTEDLDFVV